MNLIIYRTADVLHLRRGQVPTQQWLRDALRVFNKYQIGWAWWAFNSRDVTIPSPLHTTWANQRTTGEVGTTEIEMRNLEAYLVLAVVLVFAFIGTLVLSLWPRRTQRNLVTRRHRR